MNAKPPPLPAADDHPEVSAANARAGLVLFFVYLAFYAGFMALAAFAPGAMGRPVFGGVNLAITYGMGLIFGALVVAALYMAACARNASRLGVWGGTGVSPVSGLGGTGVSPVSEEDAQ